MSSLAELKYADIFRVLGSNYNQDTFLALDINIFLAKIPLKGHLPIFPHILSFVQ